jgi:hypothetical protein
MIMSTTERDDMNRSGEVQAFGFLISTSLLHRLKCQRPQLRGAGCGQNKGANGISPETQQRLLSPPRNISSGSAWSLRSQSY